eukprot:TRINITY_DN66280_c0_g1_i1.p1 TRINITY_DN66280_c0_g1~~TRINITY_DN66280_c0_g1_i1.p1  ORF type:complete len:654 (-),score=30.15 TRINITY_DN66280_c0_g1_i1:128-1975(-)
MMVMQKDLSGERLEAIALAVLGPCLLFQVPAEPFYGSQFLGVSPADVRLSGDATFYSSAPLLLCLVAEHISIITLLPIRWSRVVVLQSLCYSFYVVCVASFGAPEPIGLRIFHTVLFCVILSCTSLGKRRLERKDRELFLSMVHERVKRFESELQLSKLQGMVRDNPRPSRDCVSEASEAPTTLTANVFGSLNQDPEFGIERLRRIGTMEQWLLCAKEINLSQWTLLGVGGYGLVVRAHFHGAPCALKIPKEPCDGMKALCDIAQELRALRKLRHPNIVLFHGALCEPSQDDLILVLGFVEGTPFEDFVSRKETTVVSRCRSLIGICNAVVYLHTRTPCMVHGDLKSDNIIVEKRGSGPHSMLLDFGFARLRTRNARFAGGTYRWAAPEIFSKDILLHPSADVYSVACLIYTALVRKRPFDGFSKLDIKALARSGHKPPLKLPSSSALYEVASDFVEQMASSQPRKRPPMHTVQETVISWIARDLGGAELPRTALANHGLDCTDDSAELIFWDCVNNMRKLSQARALKAAEHCENKDGNKKKVACCPFHVFVRRLGFIHSRLKALDCSSAGSFDESNACESCNTVRNTTLDSNSFVCSLCLCEARSLNKFARESL